MKYSFKYIMLAILSLVLFWDNEVSAHDFKVEVIEGEEELIVEGQNIDAKEILVNISSKYGFNRQSRGLAQNFREYGDGAVIVGLPNAAFITQTSTKDDRVAELNQTTSSNRSLSFKALFAKGSFQNYMLDDTLAGLNSVNLVLSKTDNSPQTAQLISYLRKIDARGH